MATPESHPKARSKHNVPPHSGPPRKKTKLQHASADALPWKPVARPSEAGMGGDDGILELDEVDDVEVIYEDTEHGRVVRFNVSTLIVAKNITLSSVQVLNAEPKGHHVASDEDDIILEDTPTQSIPIDITTEDADPPELFDCEFCIRYSITSISRWNFQFKLKPSSRTGIPTHSILISFIAFSLNLSRRPRLFNPKQFQLR
jgi:hypothetical protein